MQERNALEDGLGAIGKIERDLDDQITMIELGEAEKDAAVDRRGRGRAQASCRPRRRAASSRRCCRAKPTPTTPSSKCMPAPAAPRARTGPSMLLRMYTRWAEQHGYKVEYLEETPGEGAGIKSATIQIKGHNAYGWLKGENGVHRLVRISPFDSNARRHTSFANVAHLSGDRRPHRDRHQGERRAHRHDARLAAPAASTSTRPTVAIRLTHIPTNIVVQCQQDRSQHRNRAMAWDMLRAKLYEAELQQARGEGGGRAGRQDRHRLGPPDPLLRAAALSDGEGPAHRRLDLGHRRRARRRSRSVHGRRCWRRRRSAPGRRASRTSNSGRRRPDGTRPANLVRFRSTA